MDKKMNRRDFLKLAGVAAIAMTPIVPVELFGIYEPECIQLEITSVDVNNRMLRSVATFLLVDENGWETEVKMNFLTEPGEAIQFPVPDWMHENYAAAYLTNITTFMASSDNGDNWTVAIGK